MSDSIGVGLAAVGGVFGVAWASTQSWTAAIVTGLFAVILVGFVAGAARS